MLKVVVLGTGCPNCKKLERLCYNVAAENNLPADIEKVTDIGKFADYGVMFTPGLVINGKVMSSGKIPMKTTLANWMAEANNE